MYEGRKLKGKKHDQKKEKETNRKKKKNMIKRKPLIKNKQSSKQYKEIYLQKLFTSKGGLLQTIFDH